MNSQRRAKTVIGLVAVASAVGLILTGCSRDGGGGASSSGAPVASPGITDTTISLGVITPLSGPVATNGACTLAGVEAYFGAKNAEGGVTFGDGKTRKVEITSFDDAFDPQKSKGGYDQLNDQVFAFTAGLGTATNRAWRDAAIADGVPQVLIMTGDTIFSDQKQSPWQLGFIPSYANEGEAFGKLLAESGSDHKVAMLSQNDDFGEGYVEGFKKGIEGASNITIVKELTYESTDTSVDAQITELASTGADVMFDILSTQSLAIAAMQKAQQLDWNPSWFQPSNGSSVPGILEPANAIAFPGVYTVSFAKDPTNPDFADDADVKAYLSALKTYANYPDIPPKFPHCAWSYIIGATLDQVFQKMTEPTRDDFMKELRSISGYEAPMMLPGSSVDATQDGRPAVSTVIVQKFNGTQYESVDAFG